MILQKQPFNLKDMVSEIVDEYQDRIDREKKQKIDIKLEVEKNDSNFDNLLIKADKSRITQVVTNLFDNALEYTKEGTIKMIIQTSEKEIIVNLVDSGPGIDPEILPMLFNKFVKRSSKGTGFGLYISKRIIEAHGGKMWAENNEDGPGATFSFSLPMRD